MQFPAFFTIHEIRVTPPLKMKRSPFFFFFSEIINCDLEMFFTINSGSQKWSLRTMNVCVCIISMTITAYITTYTICSKGECIFFFFELNHQIFFFFMQHAMMKKLSVGTKLVHFPWASTDCKVDY